MNIKDKIRERIETIKMMVDKCNKDNEKYEKGSIDWAFHEGYKSCCMYNIKELEKILQG